MSVTLPTDSMFGLGDYAFAGTAPNDCPDIEAVVDAAIEKRWQDCKDELREEGAQEALNNVKARIDFLLGWDRETLLPGKDYGIFAEWERVQRAKKEALTELKRDIYLSTGLHDGREDGVRWVIKKIDDMLAKLEKEGGAA